METVNHPDHYHSHPSGVGCIEIISKLPCCIANVIKYLWRADEKHQTPIKDLQKALWYLEYFVKEADYADCMQFDQQIAGDEDAIMTICSDKVILGKRVQRLTLRWAAYEPVGLRRSIILNVLAGYGMHEAGSRSEACNALRQALADLDELITGHAIVERLKPQDG